MRNESLPSGKDQAVGVTQTARSPSSPPGTSRGTRDSQTQKRSITVSVLVGQPAANSRDSFLLSSLVAAIHPHPSLQHLRHHILFRKYRQYEASSSPPQDLLLHTPGRRVPVRHPPTSAKFHNRLGADFATETSFFSCPDFIWSWPRHQPHQHERHGDLQRPRPHSRGRHHPVRGVSHWLASTCPAPSFREGTTVYQVGICIRLG